jgi:alginate O-acetyltransferase complex protein AlgI
VGACLVLGWGIVLALPSVHALVERARGWALTAGFAFTVQAQFFAPHVAPFCTFGFRAMGERERGRVAGA